MAKIIRVVLIDSINRGSNIEIQLDSNTALTGTNGIGKTSFLKLLPIFYGAAPGTIIRGDGNNVLSFANWYLPHESSYLIFDYENHEGHRCCAVMHRSGQDGYAYRLIDGEWDQGLVYQDAETGMLVKPSNLIQHCLRMQRQCSPEITQTSYRLIMQYNTGSSDMSTVQDKGQRALIETLRKRFSLAPRRKELSGIDTITWTLIDGGNNMESLNNIIADILKQDNDDPAGALGQIQRYSLEKILEDHNAYRMYESDGQPKIERLSNLLVEYHSKFEQLSKAKRRVELANERALDEKEKVSELLDERRKARDDFEADWENKREKLDKAVSEARIRLDTAEQTLARLEQQQETYAAMGIEAMARRCERKPDKQAERDDKQSELDKLEHEGANVRLEYERRISAVKDRCQQRISTERSREKPQREQAEAAKERIRNQLDADTVALQTEQANTLAPHLEAEKSIDNDLLLIAGELKFTKQLKVLPHDQQEIDLTREQIEAKRHAQADLSDAEQHHHSALAKWSDAQRALAAEKSALEKQQAAVRKELETLQAQLNASESTLLGYLRRHHSSWQENIGRLLPPTILMRDDLNPELVNSADTGNLFGVTLNTSVLPTQALANTDDLRASIARVEEDRQSLEQAEADLEVRGRKQLEAKRKLDEQEHQNRSAMARLKDDLSALSTQLESVLDRATENHQLHIQALEEQQAALRVKLEETKANIGEIKSQFGRQRVDLKTTATEALQDLDAQLKAVFEQISDAVREIEDQQSREVKELEHNMESALSEAGIDVTITRRLKNALKDLNDELTWIAQNTEKVDEYKRWVLNEWPQRAELARQFDEANRVNDNATRSKSEFDKGTKETRDAFKKQLSQLDQKRRTIDDDLFILERLGKSLESFPSDPDAQLANGQTPQDLEHDISIFKRDLSALQRSGSSLYSEALNLFRARYPNSPHAHHIEGIAKVARETAETYDEAWLYGAGHLVSDMPQFHALQKDKLISGARNIGESVSDGRIKLEELNESIIRLSREATARAKIVAESFASLDIESVKIQSKIRDMDFWGDLQYFDNQYRRWCSLGDDQLPSNGYITALEKIIRWVKDERLTTNIKDCFTLEVVMIDSGRPKKITNDSSFKSSSSEGLKLILQSMLFVSLFELLRKDADLQIIFPLDETLRLASENYIPLLQALNDRNIVVVGGFPDGSPEILSHFEHSYEFYREQLHAPLEIRQYVNPEPDELDALHAAWAELENRA